MLCFPFSSFFSLSPPSAPAPPTSPLFLRYRAAVRPFRPTPHEGAPRFHPCLTRPMGRDPGSRSAAACLALGDNLVDGPRIRKRTAVRALLCPFSPYACLVHQPRHPSVPRHPYIRGPELQSAGYRLIYGVRQRIRFAAYQAGYQAFAAGQVWRRGSVVGEGLGLG